MALTECVECGKSVSTRAASCPHCGAVQGDRTTVGVGTQKQPAARYSFKRVVLWVLAGFVGLSIVSTLVSRSIKDGRVASAPVREAGCDVRKADGSAPDRDCDLVELCKDAKHFNRKFEQAALKGDMAERNSAGVQIKKIVVWLSEYRPQDVAAVCDGKAVPDAATPAPVVATGTPSAARATSLPIGACSAAPLEVFPVGYAFTDSELQRELAQKCPGAALGPDGQIAVIWMDKAYSVETAGHREPNGVLIHLVRSIRSR